MGINVNEALQPIVDSFVESILDLVRETVREVVQSVLGAELSEKSAKGRRGIAQEAAGRSSRTRRGKWRNKSVPKDVDAAASSATTDRMAARIRAEAGGHVSNSAARSKNGAAPEPAMPHRRTGARSTPVDFEHPATATIPMVSPETGKATESESLSERSGKNVISERETIVLEAVRVLVRATASEIAQHCGLAHGTAYVALRTLVAGRKVAKLETARGVEYSLVSPGGIQPFKRAKAASLPSPPPAEAAEGVPGTAATPPMMSDAEAHPISGVMVRFPVDGRDRDT